MGSTESFSVPNTDPLVFRARNEPFAFLRGEAQRCHNPRVPLDHTKTLASRQAPAPDAVVPRPTYNRRVRWRECDARYSPGMTDESHEALARLHVAQANSIVEASRGDGEGATAGAEPRRDRHTQNLAAISKKKRSPSAMLRTNCCRPADCAIQVLAE